MLPGLFGDRSEARAARWLKKRGYRVLRRNYRCRVGEIDIVATDGDTLVFVEVKARASDRFGGASAAVGVTKQRRLAAAAAHYLSAHPTDGDVRFDVVAITAGEIELIVDAFRL